MRLNENCIRDILLTVEQNSMVGRQIPLSYYEQMDSLKKYSNDELVYHVNQLQMNNLLLTNEQFLNFEIEDLTPEGHALLAKIRNEQNWSKTKKIARSLGGLSILTLKVVANSVFEKFVSDFIDSNF
ncbi:DUF2513 domain-containing protein [Ligilactobacillus equi]|nr:DUF2513 domain-containing protein [Ligilactobacillus equi]